MPNIRLTYIFLSIVALPLCSLHAQDFRLLFGLRGEWKFELGDNGKWADPSFDDRAWETIFAPAYWEDEGSPGYDGFAWYRKHFQATSDWKEKDIYLRLGRIDDVDEVYVNGKLVGRTGSFPPSYETAYNVDREYPIPKSFLKIPGDNVVAVRVYDDQLSGGMYEGNLGVYEDRDALVPDLQLAGEWKFSTGDKLAWKEKSFNDTRWTNITVPAWWEAQGFGGYDGYAWYRVKFRVPAEMTGRKMILLLGYIDDFDETYLNGELIGKTGNLNGKVDVVGTDEWSQLRAYTLLSGQLRRGEENVLAVRVYDGFRDGGIYRGPIGLISRDGFVKWHDTNWKSMFERIFR